jgi:uncharacterized membrane protein YphA (DoxX/SURF4 family)
MFREVLPSKKTFLFKEQNFGRLKLIRYFSTFPDGMPGAALLLLRATVSISAFIQGGMYLDKNSDAPWNWVIGLFLIIGGAALLIGFLTRLFSIIIFIAALFIAILLFPAAGDILNGLSASVIYVAVIAISIFLLGPGAFSLDARLFGRREIIIPDDSIPPDS